MPLMCGAGAVPAPRRVGVAAPSRAAAKRTRQDASACHSLKRQCNSSTEPVGLQPVSSDYTFAPTDRAVYASNLSYLAPLPCITHDGVAYALPDFDAKTKIVLSTPVEVSEGCAFHIYWSTRSRAGWMRLHVARSGSVHGGHAATALVPCSLLPIEYRFAAPTSTAYSARAACTVRPLRCCLEGALEELAMMASVCTQSTSPGAASSSPGCVARQTHCMHGIHAVQVHVCVWGGGGDLQAMLRCCSVQHGAPHLALVITYRPPPCAC